MSELLNIYKTLKSKKRIVIFMVIREHFRKRLYSWIP